MENARETSETQGFQGQRMANILLPKPTFVPQRSGRYVYNLRLLTLNLHCGWVPLNKPVGASGRGPVMKGWLPYQKFPDDHGFRACWLVSVWLLQIKC